MFRSLSIRTRLIAATAIALVGLVVLSGFGLYSGRANVAALKDVYERDVRTLVLLQRIDNTLREVRFRVAGVLLDTLPVPGSLNHVREARTDLGRLWSEVQPGLAMSISAEEKALADELRAGWPAVEKVLGRIEAAYAAKNNAQLTEVLEQEWPALHKAFTKPLAALIPLSEASARGTYESAQGLGQRLNALALGLSAAVLAALCAVMLWTYRSVTSSLASADAAVRAIAAGDLTQDIAVQSRDEVGALLERLQVMQVALRKLIGDVRTGVESVTVASREIAQGNADLSARTEQQASNLQQTAASMEQMTATVNHNTESARQANQLAASASQVAAKGGAVVGEVVSTMDQISASSRKIADIIGVIDGIAFQTNILALNAAVEAARAGEQGRGFAVVAGEVRNLAQRSAQAAREIKSLIGESVEKVETGSKLVNDAGQTMSDIVQQVKRVTDLIGEITSSTLEQSNGIGQVNQAVTQLDQMTQQNAALVEQSAAAAESLKEQADKLAKAVAIFKLSRSETQQVIAEAQAASRTAVVTKAAPAPKAPAPLKVAGKAAPKPAPRPDPGPAPRKNDEANGDWKEF
jgi:methyl-accepting chemotaxis protein